jgi:hypothetical protein
MKREWNLLLSDFKLYVVDTGGRRTAVSRISWCSSNEQRDRRWRQVFADFAPGFTDGVRCDTDATASQRPAGAGGPDTNGVVPQRRSPPPPHTGGYHQPRLRHEAQRLFMTGSLHVDRIYVNAVGFQRP